MTEQTHDPAVHDIFSAVDPFAPRHLGPREADLNTMLSELGFDSLDALTEKIIPDSIQLDGSMGLDGPRGEYATLHEIRKIANKNQVFRSLIGQGYYGTIIPPAILRKILENPNWYTPYTPYQAEIAQGRLEALLNFQTMVTDLTGMEISNASLLDEATAAAEAMAMCFAIGRRNRPVFFASDSCHPQTLAVLETRAESMGMELRVGAPESIDLTGENGEHMCGFLLQYPTTDGRIEDYRDLINRGHEAGVQAVVATDLLALTLITPPGEFGADIVVGSSQRFGVPIGFGGPHAAFLATHEKHARKMPGRIVGMSRDAQGNPAYRLAIQTREQHIKRDKATSNICTAQVLLAVIASMYAVWHGPQGLQRIARRVHGMTAILAEQLKRLGHEVPTEVFFDTITVRPAGQSVHAIMRRARERRINLRKIDDMTIGISLDETTDLKVLAELFEVFATTPQQVEALPAERDFQTLANQVDLEFPERVKRSSGYLTHPVFNRYHSEHEMLRYLIRLSQKDLSLAHAMIPLGSCTMKLNSASEMIPITWPEFANMHPFCPEDQAEGYHELFGQLKSWLARITGFPAVSLQPNAGSQGEYAGLLTIRSYLRAMGQTKRDICLIPISAHGTNPASAIIAGMRVVPVNCDEKGDIDLDDLNVKADQHSEELAAIMITYPSTHGVFEHKVREVCAIVHEHGGQVYMDGANMNAQVGLTSPAMIGADVCHLNLHKTFCIPHGGGGPGMGPIACARHLAPYLPGDPIHGRGAVSAAPSGSPAILPISWMYIRMMGDAGLRKATQVAILNANYMAKKLEGHYDILYTGTSGLVAHEFIVDCRGFQKSADISVEDIAKRLMDFGFHAPTMSFPVSGTLMIEPTESESKEELDRFCEAMIQIRQEIKAIESGDMDKENNPLHNAPHSWRKMTGDHWPHPYTREQAAYPLAWVKERKFWPAVGRIDNVFGDRNLHCTCPSIEDICELQEA